MDLSEIAKKLGLSESKHIVRKAAELRRLCDVQFDSSVIGIGEVCKAIICLEIAATRFQVIFDRQAAIRLSGMSEKAYNRSFNSLQNSLGVKTKLDIRELGIQFGCVRLIPFVKNGLSLYKQRFLASLPASRRPTADFTRPVFTAVAFYLCAKRHKLKIDKLKLIEVCGTSEAEFKSVSTSMKDLCHDVFGISKEKKDPREVKCNRELLDVLPEKRKFEDGGYLSDDGPELSSYKKRKREERVAYEDWKSSVMSSNEKGKAKGSCKRTKQTRLDFLKKVPETTGLEAL
ncbi:Origin recognition complex subunit, putative [Ricinus communis]|uniref:Origin of replication complex subunit 6 n=2 Tax=Ricinus communis TaxID=3988 RepID=B9S8V3_RICCO|nr:Origin recognition complex subunit, putative [Ricinus communis]|eukprot:XP_002522422.1 origin of replication complex subunit 6 [Ricinus communis]